MSSGKALAENGVGWSRTALGFVLAPVLPLPLPMAMVGWLLHEGMLLAGAIMFAAFGCSVALLVGLPVHLFLRHRGRGDLWTYVVAGSVLGSLPCALGFFTTAPSDWFVMFLSFAGYGASAAIVFWLIVLWPSRRRATVR